MSILIHEGSRTNKFSECLEFNEFVLLTIPFYIDDECDRDGQDSLARG